ncbi:hypothetical protein F8388_014957 [Cannabis sativa]|uniref:RRM domain-containing protein n=1 Tax=Cannabis sativa TaxID=3483 RepID=A0A7J6FKT3_CANSA|nr:hypothetical protein F8388_014957 [Cannabis sativa]KAF4371316.1 hypothetical protein G4B88_003786 [Cannabis sativa]
MSTSHRLKGKYDKSNASSLHNGDEGSAARTRPLSFEEIMLRRKKKSLCEEVIGVVEAETISKEDIVKDAPHSFESDGDYRFHKGSSPNAEVHVAEETMKISSRKKEKLTSVDNKSEDNHLKGKDRRDCELENKLNTKPNNYTSKEAKRNRNDKETHERRELDKQGGRSDKEIHERREHDKEIHGRREHDKQGGGRNDKDIHERREHDKQGGRNDKEVHERREHKKQGGRNDKEIRERREHDKQGRRNDKEIHEKRERDKQGGRNDKEIHERREHDRQGDRNDKEIHERREHDKQGGRNAKVIRERREHDKQGGRNEKEIRERREHDKEGGRNDKETHERIEKDKQQSTNDKEIHERREHDKQGGRDDKQMHGRREHDRHGGRNDQQMHDRREKDKCLTDSTQNEAGKKHSRDSTGKESHSDLKRGKSERESKRKYENGDNEKPKDRNVAKKLDTGKDYDTDISGKSKGKESSKSHHEDTKMRRGRSRSRDREDRNKRSRSASLGAHKRASHNRVANKEDTSHLSKDRSEKQLYVDKSRLSSNGLTSHHRRHDESTSGLGGYSPRKRLSETAEKTPPPIHSSEKKSAKWDLPPVGAENMLSGLAPTNFQSSNIAVPASVQELASAAAIASIPRELPYGFFATSLSNKRFATIDSIQLTQATRPMRRLYVENIPSSTTEKALVDWLNDLLLSSAANHIQGTQPCLSCIINKDKGQALVEFLTPEDASAALAFDGRSISGSILKIRRPKDFVEVATGDQEKSMAAVDTITDVVKDSPNKIFIGGISKVLSSRMLMEIVSVFGSLKAYHFEANDNLDESCAFLEYVDRSVTLKACAGLNGMKLGGKVLTVVQALHAGASMENTENSSLYEIPEFAKPLLKEPTQVIKLKNVFNVEDFSLLSEPLIEEVIEDVRLECARFGSVKSVNVIRQGSSQTTGTEASELYSNEQAGGVEQKSVCEDKDTEAENLFEHVDDKLSRIDEVEFESDVKEHKEDGLKEHKEDRVKEHKEEGVTDDNNYEDNDIGTDDNKPDNILHEELPQTVQPQSDVPVEHHDDKIACAVPMDADDSENKPNPKDGSNMEDADSSKLGNAAELDGSMKTETDATEKDVVKERDFDLGSIFEVGCVIVEFGRTEAACMAAHCLHGRMFDDRVVSVEYVTLDHYKARIQK